MRQGDADTDNLFAELAREEEAAQPDAPADLAVEDWISVALFWALAGIVFLQFFTRYVLNSSLSWTEEIAQYMLMVLTFTGSAMAARRGTHIAVEFFLDKLPASARRLAHGLVAVLSTTFFAISILLCWQVAQAMQFQPMIALDQPLSLIYYGILLGLVLTTIRSALHGIARWRAGEPEAPLDPSVGGVKL
ncbi:TRAP transporter small permease [Belnapia sp. T6]|uniref:TRAP transporter small permease protein n=1 Tax=Belnapia mucosa TaxID=2804532 RepID=A0ABS1UXP4_9PROT|nr:TRAP transporter small permease [Belnapia mucosa]MBL6454092.1 TRAP transporter small permease [Belnapia mucosa]